MSNDGKRVQRKEEHLKLALEQYADQNDAFKDLCLLRPALPDISISDIDLSIELFGKRIKAPLYINAMTGGTERAKTINRKLSEIASKLGIGLALGSASVLEKQPELLATYKVAREVNPDGLLFVNFNADTSLETIERTVEELKADAIQIHVNAIQEAVMPEGDKDFNRWTDNIAKLIKKYPGKVIVKEVGFGFDKPSAQKLLDKVGKTNFFIDVGGKGGTSFLKIENERAHQTHPGFEELGMTALESLAELNSIKTKNLTLLASGGIRNALDALKCLVLNAKAVGIAGPVLYRLYQSDEKALEYLASFINDLKLLFLIFGIKKQEEAVNIPSLMSGRLLSISKHNER